MTCRRASALIPAYLDGELSAAATARLDAHLERCARCQRRMADSRRAMAALAAARPDDDAPAPDVGDLRARIAVASGRAALRRAWLVAGVTAALGAAALTSALYLAHPPGRVVEIAVQGAQDRPIEVEPHQPTPHAETEETKAVPTPQRPAAQRAIRRRPHMDPPTPAAVAQVPGPARLACRGMTAALLAALLSGGESTVEANPTVAVVIAWDDVLPEGAWNVPETSSYSAAVTLANGDRNTVATETHPADPDAPIMVAATYEPHL